MRTALRTRIILLSGAAATLLSQPAAAQTTPGTETPVVTLPGPQDVASVVPDGTGGNYVAFTQRRDAADPFSSDVFILRVGGTAPWATPVRASTGTGTASTPVLSRTPSGVAVAYSTMSKVALQRLTATGALVWPTAKIGPNIRLLHGAGATGEGVFVAFSTPAAGGDRYGMARFDDAGNVKWSKMDLGADSSTSSVAGSYAAGFCVTPYGDAIAVLPGSRLIAHKFGHDGAPAWAAAGVAVAGSYGVKNGVTLDCDEKGGVNIAWADHRRGERLIDAFAQHIAPTGTVAWAADGLELARDTAPSAVARDGSEGAFFAFTRIVSAPPFRQEHPFITRIRRDGTVAFGKGPIDLEPAAYSVRTPILEPDGKGGVFIAWQAAPTATGSSTRDIRCLGLRWVDGTGANAWGGEPARTGACGAYPANHAWGVSDGNVTLFWSDVRSGYTDVYRWTAAAVGAKAALLPPAPPAAPAPAPTPTPGPSGAPTPLPKLTVDVKPVLPGPKVPFPPPKLTK